MLEGACDLSRDLDVRLLIAAHRNDVALQQQDVSGLEDGVAQQPVRGCSRVHLLQLVLERRDPAHSRDGDKHPQQEEELCRLGNAGLEIDARVLGIHADSEVAQDVLTDVVFDLLGVAWSRCEHVVVGDEHERVVIALEADAVGERANVVPKVERSGRPVSRHHTPATKRDRLRIRCCLRHAAIAASSSSLALGLAS